MERGPLLCDPDDKAELEARNGVEQLDYITELVERGVTQLRESHVLGLQAIAVRDVYPCAGRYRDARKDVFISNSKHTVPPAAVVQAHVRDAVDWINDEQAARSTLERAAYALWRFNWIHPFAGGNGRTSRALAYLIVCMNERRMLPGVPTMPSIIYDNRDEYIVALRAVDESQREADAKSAASEGADKVDPDLSPIAEFLRTALMKQFANAIHALATKTPARG